MKLDIGYGTGTQPVEIPDGNLIGVLVPNDVDVGSTEAEVIRAALQDPIGTPPLKEVVGPGEKIVIITSDVTRPLPTYKLMPALLDELYEIGVQKEDLTLVFALGSHRAHSPEEMKKLAGERAFEEIVCVDGDPKDFVHMGKTHHGTPVDITRVVAEADKRICLGNIEYHYFAGYSGGAKAIMPGVSTREAIQSNHSLMVEAGAMAGELENNPVRKDLEEAIGYCPIHFILNAVLDEKKKIIHAVAGDFIKAHREGCKFLDKLYRVDIQKRADIVVVSQGGAPKDLNLYQTQKALDNAKHAVREGGIVILVGACGEGLGERVFEEWMTGSETAHEMIGRIREDFQLGGHKAAAIALVLENADIYLVSEMEPDFVRSIFFEPYSSLQSALDDAFQKLGPGATVLVMPYGGSTLPKAVRS